MAVNLSRNGAALTAAYEQVVDTKSDTDWALFTYEGNSNDVRLVQTGDGGLEEMVDELNSGKVMYAFCRVQDPNSGLPKYVLINWTGEGVKDSRKGICANHVSAMAGFLKGAHVTINARTEDDVEPDAILAKVAKASGANFNFHKQKEHGDVPSGPVGSVYRKVNAMEEILQTNKDDFWDQDQRDEELRQQEERKRVELERQRVETERMELEERQAKERERKAKERAQQIEQDKDKIHQKQSEEEERAREQQRLTQQDRGGKKAGISSAASAQAANEAEALVSQRSFNPRDIFKQRERSFETNNAPSAAAPRPGKVQSPFLSQASVGRESPVQPRSPEAPAPLAWRSHLSPAAAAADAAHTEQEVCSDELEDGDEATPGEDASQDYLYGTAESEEDLYRDAPTAGDYDAAANRENICAVALYDYQAVDDTEITFDPDDLITWIEMVDEGWWRGVSPDGHYGLFPANYVQLVHHTP